MAQKNQSTILFYELCRLCLDERGHCDIFERDGLSENIFRCTGVKVSLSDNLPQRICKKCLETVCKAAELRETALRNEYHLQSLFSDDEPPKASTQELMETKSSRYFEKVNPSQEPISAIENFLRVRMDLYESSVTEDSIFEKAEQASQQHSSQKPEIIKRLIHEDGNTEYKCSKCPKKFDKWKKLYLHNRLHDKKYCCPLDMCGKKFTTKGDMEKHIRTHTGEKPFQCDMCDKSFSQRGTLKSHKETIHSVERYLVGMH